MLARMLALALVITLGAAPAHAQAEASASPSAAATPAPAAAAANVPAEMKDLAGTYVFDIDYVLEQNPEYMKFDDDHKKLAHDKALADSPKLEISIADHIKISENSTVKTDATYKLVKKTGTVYAVEMTDQLGKDKKAEVVNFDLQGTRMKMTKDGEKDVLVWVKSK